MDATRELSARLHDVLRSVRLIKSHHAVDRSGLPMGMIGMLAQIDGLATGCHARELALRTGLDPSTVSRTVATLAAHGWIERRVDPTDRRASVLAITPAGRSALADARDRYARALAQALAGWTDSEIAALSAALGRFARDIETALGQHDRTRRQHDNETLEAAR